MKKSVWPLIVTLFILIVAIYLVVCLDGDVSDISGESGRSAFLLLRHCSVSFL